MQIHKNMHQQWNTQNESREKKEKKMRDANTLKNASTMEYA